FKFFMSTSFLPFIFAFTLIFLTTNIPKFIIFALVTAIMAIALNLIGIPIIITIYHLEDFIEQNFKLAIVIVVLFLFVISIISVSFFWWFSKSKLTSLH